MGTSSLRLVHAPLPTAASSRKRFRRGTASSAAPLGAALLDADLVEDRLPGGPATDHELGGRHASAEDVAVARGPDLEEDDLLGRVDGRESRPSERRLDAQAARRTPGGYAAALAAVDARVAAPALALVPVGGAGVLVVAARTSVALPVRAAVLRFSTVAVVGTEVGPLAVEFTGLAAPAVRPAPVVVLAVVSIGRRVGNVRRREEGRQAETTDDQSDRRGRSRGFQSGLPACTDAGRRRMQREAGSSSLMPRTGAAEASRSRVVQRGTRRDDARNPRPGKSGGQRGAAADACAEMTAATAADALRSTRASIKNPAPAGCVCSSHARAAGCASRTTARYPAHRSGRLLKRASGPAGSAPSSRGRARDAVRVQTFQQICWSSVYSSMP